MKTYIFTNYRRRKFSVTGDTTIDDLVKMGAISMELVPKGAPLPRNPSKYRCDPSSDFTTTKKEKTK